MILLLAQTMVRLHQADNSHVTCLAGPAKGLRIKSLSNTATQRGTVPYCPILLRGLRKIGTVPGDFRIGANSGEIGRDSGKWSEFEIL
jgi:hypothetical protein